MVTIFYNNNKNIIYILLLYIRYIVRFAAVKYNRNNQSRGLVACAYFFYTVTKIAEYKTNTFHALTKLVLKFYFVFKCIF